MTITHKGELLRIAVGIARQYEADAFMAEVRADAYAAAGDDEHADADRKEASKAATMAASATEKVNQLTDELRADGNDVTIQPDGTVAVRPPDAETTENS